jgi:hypothetical protein
MTGATKGAGIVNHYGAPELTPSLTYGLFGQNISFCVDDCFHLSFLLW